MSLNLNPISKIVESYMDDTVIVKRRASSSTSAVTGQVTTLYDVIYSGKGFITTPGNPYEKPLGADKVATAAVEIGLPKDCPPVEIDDIIECTASLRDAAMVGRFFKVIGQNTTTFFTHRRIQATLDDRRS